MSDSAENTKHEQSISNSFRTCELFEEILSSRFYAFLVKLRQERSRVNPDLDARLLHDGGQRLQPFDDFVDLYGSKYIIEYLKKGSL